ncbi:[citrate (pro-3S)-lyase] ligase [[Haemophilus] ducreyi]|uniref:[Citrate [pro-3S]-lyase] ligase n=2 Tax=Haemophilus ducreyi TaxID=730 RepID=Q7VLZ3_HAEDU|nr:[citrate (pro-3S)-lyase] ligase [[Haemophilus] ducreyi]AAP96076.1 [citrate [pro-3S]-lyase] ligase [[Haemophilus] ducreyi 35000HP]AKO31059.1 citrate (pro-3S)-lyase [[Haemophilus] ducreyi]AKO32503.1 citrate (pro-3S)-lyase [[Haemophilus] ducreyi]AKO33954.1 citrate (pro-3S)-lyase [[Haemophilus] ducreyi]AKO35401.1 citrate (pro-3S)-lyase [[Haemophilus] ducreyi]
MQFERVSIHNHKKMLAVCEFLTKNDLRLDKQVELFIVVYNDTDNIIACGGLAQNIIKCVAISDVYRGEGIALQLVTELVNVAYEFGRSELFIFTKPEYALLFKSCGFYPISTAYPYVVLLENSATRLQKQCLTWQKQAVVATKVGATVMNANPFTLGHRYLIEQALAQCDHLHLFVVEEEASQFCYQERFALVQHGIADLSNITLHPSSQYIISRATFPDYFLKDSHIVDAAYLELDLRLFRQHIAPALAITHRFIGTEPFCPVTAEYNRKMHYWLQQAVMEADAINVVEIERKKVSNQAISASTVRQLFSERKWQQLLSMVPITTFNFLQKIANEPG